MNNNIIQTIYMTVRVGAVLGVAFFAFAGDALAAPYLTPVTVSDITGTSAMLTGHVSNSQKQSTVWFEINNNYGGAPTTVSVQGIWNDGSFKWYMDNLTPGQTYSYRSVATDGSSTVYSPMSSFTTVVPKPIVSTSVSYQSSPATSAPAVKAAQVETKVITVVKEATSTPATPKDQGFTNNNAASVIGVGNGILPTTLIGWMILVTLLLVLVIVAHMIYQAPENRKKAALAKNGEEEDLKNK